MVQGLLSLLFLLTTLLSVFLGLSAQNLFSAWVCLELNLLGFVGFLVLWKALTAMASLKYFLIQSLGSGLLLLAVFLMSKVNVQIFTFLGVLSLSLKLAAAPLYGWVLLLVEELDWFAFLMLSSIQKVLPLFLILSFNHWSLAGVSSVSAAMAAFSALSESSLKKTMALSSVFGAAWFLGSSSVILSLGYLLFYSLSLGLASHIWSLFSSNEVLASQLSASPLSSFLMLSLSLLNFSGLPPFSLFYFKLSILMNVVFSSSSMHLSCLLLAAVVFIYIYLRIGLTCFQFTSESPVALSLFGKMYGNWLLGFFVVTFLFLNLYVA